MIHSSSKKKKNKTKARLVMHEEWRWIVGKGTA